MSRSDGVYLRVMQDVIEKTHQRFVERYGDDSKLTQMQTIWKLKMVNSEVIPAAHVTPVVRNVHPTRGGCDGSKLSLQKKDNESKLKSCAELKPGKIAAYMQQPCRPWINHRPLNDHVNDVMPPFRKRKQQELPSKFYKKRCILQLDDLEDTASDHSAHQQEPLKKSRVNDGDFLTTISYGITSRKRFF